MTTSLPDDVLILGATLRLSRLVVTDDLGQWWVKDPLYLKAARYMDGEGDGIPPRWSRYLSGLDCPFCVGFHMGWLVLASHAATRRSRIGHAAWRFAAAALTLNEVAAHIGVRLGDVADKEG